MEPSTTPTTTPEITPVAPEAPTPASLPTPEISGTQKSLPWIPLIFLILFLAILAAGIFFFLQAQSLKKQLTSTAPSSPTPSVTPATKELTDESATWQTYDNAQFGFSFKYPQTLMFKYDELSKYVPVGINNSNLLIQNFDGMKAGGDGDSDFQMMILVANNQGFNMEDLATPKNISINNVSATQGTTTIKMEKSIATIFNVQPHKIAVVLTSKQSSQNILLYHQILSTFKFNESESVDNILQLIPTLTAPMIWSAPIAGTLQGAHDDATGTLIVSNQIATKTDNKLAPLLVSDSVLISQYGWTLALDESADGMGESITTFKKGTQKLIIRYQGGIYKVLLSQ